MNKLNDIISIDLHIHSTFSAYNEYYGYVKNSIIENFDVLFHIMSYT